MKVETLHSLILKDLDLLKHANARQYEALNAWLKNDVKDWLVDKINDHNLRLNLISIVQACHAHMLAFWGNSPEKPAEVKAYFEKYPHRNL
jgi:hypothetical protein